MCSVKCIKMEGCKFIVQERDIRVSGSSIFKTYLMSVMIYIYILPYLNMIDIIKEDKNYNYYYWIQKHEVKEVLKRMSDGKEVGLENIPIKV